MTASQVNDRFSRQVNLPSVGLEGQKKWEEAQVLLAGEGVALEASRTALERVGLSRITLLNNTSADPLPVFSAALVVTENPVWRRNLNRQLRTSRGKAVFAWPSGGGWAVLPLDYSRNPCPCFECFEVMNPKAFSPGTASIQRLLAAMGASETLQLILNADSPILGKVWLTSLEGGISLHHEVRPASKCPARLTEEEKGITS